MITLLLLVSFVVVLALAIAPALPQISSHLGLTKETTQLLISVYLIGFAIGHLFYGPLANQYGRKPMLLICLVLSLISALGCLIAVTLKCFSLLLAFRLLMALVASGTLKLSYNMAADLYCGPKLTRMTSYFIISFAVAPPIAIFLCGYLTTFFHYQSIFLFIMAYSLLLFAFSLHLPETCMKKEANALSPLHIARQYLASAKKGHLMLSALVMGLAVSIVYLYGAEAPFISEERIGMSPSEFGILTLLPYAGMLLGAIFCAVTSSGIKPVSLILWGGGLTLFFGLLMTLFFTRGHITTPTFFLPTAGLFLGIGLISSTCASIALTKSANPSYDSASLNFIINALNVIAVIFLAALSKHNLLAYPITLASIGALQIILTFILRKKNAQSH